MPGEVDRAARDVVRACYVAGDDLDGLRDRFLHRLRRAVAVDSIFFAATDPDTLLFTATWADEPLRAVAPLFLDNEFGPGDDVNRFAALARADNPVSTLDRATGGDRATSRRSHEIMSPMGLGDELRVALRTSSATWGFLCLHRAGPTGFVTRDVDVLQRVAPHAGAAIRRIVSTAATDAREGGSRNAVVLVAGDTVVATSDDAPDWIEDLGAVPGEPVPLPLMTVVRRLETIERTGVVEPAAAMRIATRRGALLAVHATRLRHADGLGAIALTVSPADASDRSSLLFAAYGLTPAQRRVAELVVQGRSTRQIVVELRISQHTVQDHLKAVFDKTGVRSRRDLIATLLHPASSP